MSQFNPPWIEYPDIPWGSIGWRMGFGEDHWNRWMRWFQALPEADRQAYKSTWPEAEGWLGFYAFAERGTTPPWALEHRRRLAQPQAPPKEAENEITDYFRVVWLVRHHLKREVYPYGIHGEQRNRRQDEDQVEFYSEPSGQVWRLGFIAKGGLRLTRASVDA